jgi:hypothetical protein
MKKSLILSFVLIATVALSSMAFAVELSADMVNKFGGQVKYSKIYIKNNKFRMESKEGETFTIARQDLKKAWLVMTKQKAYIEMKPDASKLPEEKVKGEVGRRFIGNEMIDGHPSKKYEISYKNDKTTLKSYQWIATDISFPVKTAEIGRAHV